MQWHRNTSHAAAAEQVKAMESRLGSTKAQSEAEHKRLQKQRNIAMMKLEAVKEDEFSKKLRQILTNVANKYGAAGGFTSDQLVTLFMA